MTSSLCELAAANETRGAFLHLLRKGYEVPFCTHFKKAFEYRFAPADEDLRSLTTCTLPDSVTNSRSYTRPNNDNGHHPHTPFA